MCIPFLPLPASLVGSLRVLSVPVSGPDLGFFFSKKSNASIPGIFRVLSVLLRGRAAFRLSLACCRCNLVTERCAGLSTAQKALEKRFYEKVRKIFFLYALPFLPGSGEQVLRGAGRGALGAGCFFDA